MALNRKSVELLAPAGTWAALVAAIQAGADAVYLGGKHFNMRVHKNDFNLTDEELKSAVSYAHDNGAKLYITLNNLISVEEIEPLKKYLYYLNEIQPDALIVQDLAVVHLVRELKLNLPIHISVMANTNNIQAVELMKSWGITRIVVGRELSLAQMSLLKEKTGIELESFIHGDMCVAASGQCIHSGIIFGQSGNRGRCLKPCRWAYKFIDEDNHKIIDDTSHKLAVNDMCMLRNIPELIQAGVYSFKIEGRMRPPEFISRIVSTYRKAIDDYIENPVGWSIDENIWSDFYNKRVRDFTTLFSFKQPDKKDFGLSGEREPRFFSEGIVEKDFDDIAVKNIFDSEREIKKFSDTPSLNVRVGNFESANSAIDNGANLIYVDGENFTLAELKNIVESAHEKNLRAVLNTPRITTDKILNELAELFIRAENINFDGVMVSNLGALNMAKNYFKNIFADTSFNLFNNETAEFLKNLGVIQATASLELSFAQVRAVVENSDLPIEIVVHGAIESMICEHNFTKLYYPGYDDFATPELMKKNFALEDSAGEIHSIRFDKFNHSHIYFAKDLCLIPYIKKFLGANALRIEAQNYSPEVVGLTTKIYRAGIDNKNFDSDFDNLKKISPKKFGCGIYRFKQSKNSI